MREIGAKTSFARSSIYNYFQTKEEIQLGLTIREFTAWKDALQKFWRMKTKIYYNLQKQSQHSLQTEINLSS